MLIERLKWLKGLKDNILAMLSRLYKTLMKEWFIDDKESIFLDPRNLLI